MLSDRFDHSVDTIKWDGAGQLGAGGDVVPIGELGVALLSGAAMQLK